MNIAHKPLKGMLNSYNNHHHTPTDLLIYELSPIDAMGSLLLAP